MPSAGEMAAIEKPFGVHFNPEDCQQLISIVDAEVEGPARSPFFAATSFITSISRSRSATSFFNRAFSAGRAHVRQVLYMAAMSASNWNPAFKTFHDRLKAAGKLPKVAIVAVMRKMITALNAMVRDDVVWADRHCGRHSVPTAR